MAEPSINPLLLRKVENETNGSPKGANRTIESYLEPEEIEEIVKEPTAELNYATNTTQILENYPFIGTLFKKTGANYRIKHTYRATSPGSIEKIENEHGPGEYQLRFITNRDEKILSFSVKGEDNPIHHAAPAPANFNEELLQTRISRLESRLDERTEELDESFRKIRKLNTELLEHERTLKSRFESDIERYKSQLDEQREKVTQLDRKVFELELEAKIEGRDKEGILDYIEAALENEAVQGIMSAVIGRFSPQVPGANPQLPAGRENPSPSQNNELNDSAAMQNNAQTITQDVVNSIFQIGINALTAQNPDFAKVKTSIDGALSALTSQNLSFAPQNWINIAKGLVQYTVEHNVPTQRLADVVSPLLDNLEMAKGMLSSMPVKIAVKTLESAFSMNLDDKERTILTEVLQLFKKRLS